MTVLEHEVIVGLEATIVRVWRKTQDGRWLVATATIAPSHGNLYNFHGDVYEDIIAETIAIIRDVKARLPKSQKTIVNKMKKITNQTGKGKKKGR